MIDTIKIYTQIDKTLYKKILYFQNIMSKFNESTGELFYKITSDDLKGSYDSNIHVAVGSGAKYNFIDSYYCEIECSPHKVFKGHNAFDGFCSLTYIAMEIVLLVEKAYNIELPDIEQWFCCRADITKVFDLKTQEVVNKYIESLKYLSYGRRKKEFYNGGIYFPGTHTTVKIYNKLAEFEKHDRKKLLKFADFNVFEFETKIQGYIRFECEVKSKKLKNTFGKKQVKVIDIDYKILEKIWCEEFMKVLKFEDLKDKNINKRVKTKNDVIKRLKTIYPDSPKKVNLLYSFFMLILNDGYDIVKTYTSKPTFYRNIKLLKKAGIDFSQSNFDDIAVVNFDSMIDFDPFTAKEVI